MLISESEWTSLHQRAQLPAFEVPMQRLRQDVEAFLKQPLAIPTAPAGYYHDYFCPQHGIQLVFDPAAPTEHRCPVDDAVFRGAPYDTAWRWFVNNRFSEAILRLALLWRLEGDPVCYARATDILKGYARQYPGYAERLRSGPNPGVATFSTLDEAVWILPLTWAFDALRDRLSPEEEHVSRRLLASAAEHLVEHHLRDIHNVTCWQNAAIGTIGLVLGREDLIKFAIHGEHGFEAQLSQGVLDDGLWFEGSFSYHFYTLAALLALAKATRHAPGLDLRQRPGLRDMLFAPIRCAYPDGSLPATNDCWYFTSLVGECCHGVPPSSAFYELGYAWYGDPLFAQVLDRAYRSGPRDSLEALLFGRETIPPGVAGTLASVHLPSSGLAILRTHPPALPGPQRVPAATSRADAQQQRYILLKYGPHGDAHGHPDKLSLALYAHGRRQSPDLGTPGYGIGLWESWYRQTLSHNTVTIDGMSQPPATGQARFFRDEAPFQAMDAAVGWQHGTHNGITMRRAVLARPEYFLDVFLVACDRPRRIDWVYRNVGRCETALALTPYASLTQEGDSYEHILEAGRAVSEGDPGFTWYSDGVGLQLFMAGALGAEIIAGSAPGNPPNDRQGLVINRRRSVATVFLSVFHTYEGTPDVSSVRWIGRDLPEKGWAGCVVQLADRQELWLIRLSSYVAVPALPVGAAGATTFEYCLNGNADFKNPEVS